MAVPLYFSGPTPGALRVATESISLALVVGVYLLARELFDRKIGLLTAFICAINVWGIYHGRLATRFILVPVVLSRALLCSLSLAQRAPAFLDTHGYSLRRGFLHLHLKRVRHPGVVADVNGTDHF